MKLSNLFNRKFTYMLTLTLLANNLMGCARYTPTSQLNIYHANVIEVYGEPFKEISGVFCSRDEFNEVYTENKEPGLQLSIVLQPDSQLTRDYTFYIRSGFHKMRFDETNYIIDSPFDSDIYKFSEYREECGPGNKYPYMYWFAIELGNISLFDIDKYNYKKGDDEYIKIVEYNKIMNQLSKDNFLDLRVIRIPFFNIFESTIGSEKDARIYFTDEQVRELLSINE